MDQPTEIQQPAENKPNHGDHDPEITFEATEPEVRSPDLGRSMTRGALQLGEAKAKRGLSNRQLASMLHVSAGLVSAWLNALKKPTEGQRQRIAKTFGIAPEALDQVDASPPTTAETAATLETIGGLLRLSMSKRDRGRLVGIIDRVTRKGRP